MIQFYAVGLAAILFTTLAATGVIFDGDGDDDDDTTPPPPPDGPNDLKFEDAVTPEGTDDFVVIGSGESDDFAAGQDIGVIPAGKPVPDIAMREGDDAATVGYAVGINVFGEGGNDTLEATTAGNFLHGGEGDDVLTAVDGNELKGDLGNDTFNINANTLETDLETVVRGDDGDDIFNLYSDVGLPAKAGGAIQMAGGKGADTFNVVMNLNEPTEEITADDDLTTTLGKIVQFNAEEDTIAIYLNGLEGREYTVSVEKVEPSGDPKGELDKTSVTLNFAATDTAPASVATFKIGGAVLTADDIKIFEDKTPA